MIALLYAQQRARQCRDALGTSPQGLLARIERYLLDAYGIEMHAANQTFLDGGRAEVSPAEGCLFYDARLDADPAEKRVVILHEVGHLELHPRLQRSCAMLDPVYGSIYTSDGAMDLARYNRRAREEAEANAFAAAFLCPSDEVLQLWRAQPHLTTVEIARQLEVPVSLVRTQLAAALYGLIAGETLSKAAPRQPAVAYDSSQREAAMCTGVPVLVNAGPGTGKTATLVRRIAYLLEIGATPEQMLVLTFSNHAADELRERVATQFGDAIASQIEISTFHGFGVGFLYRHGQLLDIDSNVTVLDEIGQEELLAHLVGTVPDAKIMTLHDPDATVKALVRHIGYLKDRLYTPQQLATVLDAWQPGPGEQARYEAARACLDLYRAYEAGKREQQRVDFADLIALPIRILSENPALQRAYQAKYRWVMVDEYQDVSRAVAVLLRRLCGSGNPPWVVGDVRQAIYRFRGAAPENVSQFAEDFPGAATFHLHTNYRSCQAIITAANQLSALMDTSGSAHDAVGWHPGRDIPSIGTPPVRIARADSDQAEYEGIAAQIEAWLEMGVPARDIAVLARRHIDVRHIALTLGKRHIRTTTAGLVTPEGAAGDLAAIATLTDYPGASLPRLAFALGRGQYAPQTINRVIAQAYESLDGSGRFEGEEGEVDCGSLARLLREVVDALKAEHFSGDAFTMMCVFLFDGSPYLRELLDVPMDSEQALTLGEITSALSRAAAYRFLHPDADPQMSRKGFAQYFRAALCTTTSIPAPPQQAADAVRVMTCHAAKGLEFPCVIVAGQSLSPTPWGYPWLPPALAPSGQEDMAQASALFFVGATRAQQGLVVTYASSAGGTTHARQRDLPPLLTSWLRTQAIDLCDLPPYPQQRQQVVMGALWGGAPSGELAVRALDPQSCPIRTYLEHYRGIRFPRHIPPLYPVFFDTIRRAMGRVVRRAHHTGAAVSREDATAMFLAEWATRAIEAHPHQAFYEAMACIYIGRFADAYQPHPKAQRHLDLTVGAETPGLVLRHDLVALYEAIDGTTVAVTWRPESVAAKTRSQGLLWSALNVGHRVSFVLLKRDNTDLRPYVFSAEDGRLYPYQWSHNRQNVEREVDRLLQRLQVLEDQQFDTAIRPWACDRCPVRISCPYWIGALTEEADPLVAQPAGR